MHEWGAHSGGSRPAYGSRRPCRCLFAIMLAGVFLFLATAPSRCGEDAVDIGQLTRQAESGDVEAQYLLGKAYRERMRGDQEARRLAIDWLTKAYEGGEVEAGSSLAGLYYNDSERTGENLKKALAYAEEVAATGSPEGAYILGIMYTDGLAAEKNYEVAVEWLRKAAGGGSAKGVAALGLMYMQGFGVPVDHEEAFRLLTQAYDMGFVRAASSLGFMYMKGLSVEQDAEKAQELLEEAHEGGEINATVNLFVMFDEGLGVPADFDKALYWARQALKAYNPDPAYVIADHLVKGEGVEQNIDAAIALLTEVFAVDPPLAAYNIGKIYRFLVKDAELAEEWLRKASDLGSPKGSSLLAEMHEEGDFGKKDPDAALKWYALAHEQGDMAAPYKIALIRKQQDKADWLEWMEKAVAMGNGEAADQVGLMYANGNGVPKDREKAAEYFLMSAETGYPGGAFHYGVSQVTGIGVAENREAGIANITWAAENGNADAMFMLGKFYRAGQYVDQDNAAAANWFGKAHRAGHPEASEKIKEMRAEAKKK